LVGIIKNTMKNLILFVLILSSINSYSQISIKSGTELILKNVKEVDNGDVIEGEKVFFILHKDVIIDGKKVLKKGLEAQATVLECKRTKLFGKLKIKFDLLYLENGDGIKLKSTKTGVPSFFDPNGSDIKKGAIISAFVAEDFVIN